jgi:hypothetical protein
MAIKRQQTPTLAVLYSVEQDQNDGRWNILRGGAPTGAYARDKSTAIGLALQSASREANADLKTAVFSVENRKRTKEWESP